MFSFLNYLDKGEILSKITKNSSQAHSMLSQEPPFILNISADSLYKYQKMVLQYTSTRNLRLPRWCCILLLEWVRFVIFYLKSIVSIKHWRKTIKQHANSLSGLNWKVKNVSILTTKEHYSRLQSIIQSCTLRQAAIQF